MVYCTFHMMDVTRNKCLYCKEQGAPDNCDYAKQEPEQTTLGI